MNRVPPRATRTETRFPRTTLFPSTGQILGLLQIKQPLSTAGPLTAGRGREAWHNARRLASVDHLRAFSTHRWWLLHAQQGSQIAAHRAHVGLEIIRMTQDRRNATTLTRGHELDDIFGCRPQGHRGKRQERKRVGWGKRVSV